MGQTQQNSTSLPSLPPSSQRKRMELKIEKSPRQIKQGDILGVAEQIHK